MMVLYPIDTLKVQCQAKGVGVRTAVACLRASNPGPLQMLRAMYAGGGSTAAISAVIGALYLVSFLQTQRWLSR